MRKVTIVGPRQASIETVADPVPLDNWVVVKVMTAPLCAEYKGFLAGTASTQLGHEAAGEVVAVAQPCRVAVGDRVAVMPLQACGRCHLCLAGEYIHCQSAADFAEIHGTLDGSATLGQYLLKQDWQLVPIPNDVSYDHGALACCGLGPTFGALERLRAVAHERIVITGLGPVGLGGVINAADRGLRVIAVDTNPWRRRRAAELGAELTVDPSDPTAAAQIMDFSAGLGVDCAIDCAGVVAAHRLCIDVSRRHGRIAFVGECRVETPIVVSNDLIRKGLALYGSWHYNMKDTPRMMALIHRLGNRLEQLISHRFAMDDAQQAWELQLGGESAKVLLHPWGDCEPV